jgi:hypothetical protein
MMNDRLDVRLYREGRQIIAVVNDGVGEFRYRFGGCQSVKHINTQIPILYMDAQFDRQIRAKVAV